MAQPIFSLFYLIIGLLLDNTDAKATVYSFIWMLFDKSITFCVELSDLFCWLVWISSIFKLILLNYFGPIYVLFLVLLNDRRLRKEKYSRRYRRSNCINPINIYDERIMILSGIRIYAHLVKFYCRALHTLSSILWDSYTFQSDTCNRLRINCRETEPPWPNILKRIFNVIAIFFVFLSVNFMVIELVLFYTKNAIKQYIYEWKYKFFKDCQLIPSENEQYFFNCQDYILPSNQNTTNLSVQQENCHICHEEDQALQS